MRPIEARPEPARVRVYNTVPPDPTDGDESAALSSFPAVSELPLPERSDVPGLLLSEAPTERTLSFEAEEEVSFSGPPLSDLTTAEPASERQQWPDEGTLDEGTPHEDWPPPPLSASPELVIELRSWFHQGLMLMGSIKDHTEDSARNTNNIRVALGKLEAHPLSSVIERQDLFEGQQKEILAKLDLILEGRAQPVVGGQRGWMAYFETPCQRGLEKLGVPPKLAHLLVAGGTGATAAVLLLVGVNLDDPMELLGWLVRLMGGAP